MLVKKGGSLFLFNRRVLRFFRKDGHSWRKKKDGRTVGEAHERLKVLFYLGKSVIWYSIRNGFDRHITSGHINTMCSTDSGSATGTSHIFLSKKLILLSFLSEYGVYNIVSNRGQLELP